MEVAPALRPVQTEGVRYIKTSYKIYRGFLLADKMGLGKTATAITLLKQAIKGKDNIGVIVCPAYLVYNWLDELEMWGVNLKSVCVIDKGSQVLGPAKIFIGSYNLMSCDNIWKQMMKKKPALTICDEGHYLKSKGTKRTRRIIGNGHNPNNNYLKKSGRFLILTGTPIINRIGEIFTIINRLFPEILNYMSETEFLRQYAGTLINTPWGLKHKGIRNGQELATRLAPVMLCRKVIEGLPDRVDKYIRLNLKGKELKNFIKQEEQFLIEHGLSEQSIEAGQKLTAMDMSKLSEIRQHVALCKVPHAMQLIEDTLEKTNQIIIYVYHRKVQSILEAEIIKKFKNKRLAIVNGNVPMKKRHEIIKDYQAGSIKILLNTIGSLKEGANLTSGNHVLFIEFPWEPASIEQAIARLWRSGQKNTVFATFLFFEKGIDQYIINLIKEKAKVIEQVIK